MGGRVGRRENEMDRVGGRQGETENFQCFCMVNFVACLASEAP